MKTIVALSLALASAIASASENLVTWKVTLKSEGKLIHVIANATIQSGWHIYPMDSKYGMPTSIEVKGKTVKLSGKIQSSKPVTRKDPGGDDYGAFVENAQFTFDIENSDPKSKTTEAELVLTSQACNDEGMCRPPETTSMKIKVALNASVTPKPKAKTKKKSGR